MQNLLQDLRYALRSFVRSPGFTLASVLSLALGIGANTAVFMLVDRLLLRPLPVSAPDELVLVTALRPDSQTNTIFSYPLYTGLRDSRLFRGLIARAGTPINAVVGGQPIRVQGELVSGNYFDTLGLKAAVGRTFSLEEDRTPGTYAVAVLSYGFWQRAFGLIPGIVGSNIQINDVVFQVIGVAEKGFSGTDIGSAVDVWVPLMMQAQLGRDHLSDRSNWLEMIGRLNNGVTTAQAEAAITLEFSHQETPAQTKLVPAARGISAIRAELSTAFALLMVLTWLGILLACSNVGNLVIARSESQAKETSIKIALGARRGRLALQFLVESLSLCAFGCAGALAMSSWAAAFISSFHSGRLQAIDTSVDLRIFGYAVGASLIAGILIGLAPTFRLRQAGTVPTAAPRLPLRDGLIVAQLAIALVMLISSGLMLQSLGSLRSVNPGFRVDNLLLVSLDPASVGYEGARLRTFWTDLLQKVRALPGMRSATLARTAPLAPGRQRQHISAEGFTNAGGGEVEIDSNFVGPDYFRTLDIPMVRGRDFDENDRMDSPHVVIVNEGVANMVWPNQDPIGKRMRVGGSNSPPVEVVGVVKDAKYRNLRDEPLPMVYRPVQQTASHDMMTLHMRFADPAGMAELVRQQIRSLDPMLSIFRVTTFEEQLDSSLGETRQAAAVSGGFGVLALILSAVGVYGLTAFVVSRRTREIGIRLALGASASHIAKSIARRGLVLLAAGVVAGLVGAYAVTRIFATLLFGVSSSDIFTFAGAAVLLALVSVAAMVVPVRMAIRLDPISAIRNE